MSKEQSSLARLAGGVAHDLNNLLTSITALSALALQDLPPDHPTRPDLVEIERAAQRAVALSRQLLAIAGARGGRPAPTDLGEAITRLEPELRALVDGRATLRVLRPSDALVVADGRHVEQILKNLVASARDSAGAGGTIDLEIAKEGNRALIVVRDSGPALEQEDVANLFEPFWTTRGGRKLGLSLAAAASLARSSGGGLEARLGTGSPTLALYLPLA